MPITKSAQKALRVSLRKNVVNSRVRSQMKTAIDAVKSNPSLEILSTAYSKVDKAVKKNIIHRNKASRVKAQMAKAVKTASSTAQ